MKQKRFWIVMLVMLTGLIFSSQCLAEEVIKVGAVQPVTGRFAFAGGAY